MRSRTVASPPHQRACVWYTQTIEGQKLNWIMQDLRRDFPHSYIDTCKIVPVLRADHDTITANSMLFLFLTADVLCIMISPQCTLASWLCCRHESLNNHRKSATTHYIVCGTWAYTTVQPLIWPIFAGAQPWDCNSTERLLLSIQTKAFGSINVTPAVHEEFSYWRAIKVRTDSIGPAGSVVWLRV